MRNILSPGLVFLLLLGSLAIAGELPSGGESRWVVNPGTALKAEGAAASVDLLPLEVGTQVIILETSGRWLKVQAPGKATGWVFSGRLSLTPPVVEVAAKDDLFAASAQQSQIEIAQAESGRSIRGLSAETESYAKDRGTPREYRQALDQILARQVNKDDLVAFMKSGKLGEYAQ